MPTPTLFDETTSTTPLAGEARRGGARADLATRARGWLATLALPERVVPLAIVLAVVVVFAVGLQRVRAVGRPGESGRESSLPGSGSPPAPLDVHDHAHGPLHPRHLAELRSGLRALGHAARGIPFHEPRAPRRERGARLLAGSAPPRGRAAGHERDGATRGGRRGCPVLRLPPAAGGVGRVGAR